MYRIRACSQNHLILPGWTQEAAISSPLLRETIDNAELPSKVVRLVVI